MKTRISPAIIALAVIGVVFPGCHIIGGLIKGAFWLGVIVVILVILAIWWIVGKFRGPKS